MTHDARAAAYADRVLVVRDGEILETIQLGRRADHEARPLITRLAELGLLARAPLRARLAQPGRAGRCAPA